MIDTERPDSSLEISGRMLHLDSDLRRGFDEIEELFVRTPSLARYALFNVQEAREELVANEKVFIDRVVGAVRRYDTEQAPIVLLFDIDETIMKKMLNEEGTDIMHPAVAPLMRHLKKTYGDRMHIGLLSSRGQQSIERVASSAAFLDDDGVSMLDNQYVESSRDGRVVDSLRDYRSLEYKPEADILGSLEPYLSTTARAIREDVDTSSSYALSTALSTHYRLGSIRDPKLSIMGEFAQREPSATFILVDDLPIVEVLDDSNVHGVSVFTTGCFRLV